MNNPAKTFLWMHLHQCQYLLPSHAGFAKAQRQHCDNMNPMILLYHSHLLQIKIKSQCGAHQNPILVLSLYICNAVRANAQQQHCVCTAKFLRVITLSAANAQQIHSTGNDSYCEHTTTEMRMAMITCWAIKRPTPDMIMIEISADSFGLWWFFIKTGKKYFISTHTPKVTTHSAVVTSSSLRQYRSY